MSVKKINPPAITPEHYPAMGEQLTSQYHRAVSGMVEVLKFGAMLMQIRETLTGVQVRTPDGKFEGGDGLKTWLEEHAPDIKRPTAYRFLGVADAISREYHDVVGARISKKYSLPELVIADPDQLPAAAQAKQLELFDWVAGTSQRSWLDKYKAKDPKVGNHQKYTPPKDATQEAKVMAYTETLDRMVTELRTFVLDDKHHAYLTHEKIESARLALQDVCKAMK